MQASKPGSFSADLTPCIPAVWFEPVIGCRAVRALQLVLFVAAGVVCMADTVNVWAGLGWAGLGWAGLGWAGLGCDGLAWPKTYTGCLYSVMHATTKLPWQTVRQLTKSASVECKAGERMKAKQSAQIALRELRLRQGRRYLVNLPLNELVHIFLTLFHLAVTGPCYVLGFGPCQHSPQGISGCPVALPLQAHISQMPWCPCDDPALPESHADSSFHEVRVPV